MERIVSELNLLKYEKSRHECIAEWLGGEIIVDPYVGCVWKDDFIRLGKIVFEGFLGF